MQFSVSALQFIVYGSLSLTALAGIALVTLLFLDWKNGRIW